MTPGHSLRELPVSLLDHRNQLVRLVLVEHQAKLLRLPVFLAPFATPQVIEAGPPLARPLVLQQTKTQPITSASLGLTCKILWRN